MPLQTVRSALSLIRSDGLSALAKTGGDKLSSTFSDSIRPIHDGSSPAWVSSDTDFHSYCLDETEYVIAQRTPNQDVELTIDTSDADAVEVPIVSAEHSTAITISTPTRSHRIDIDDSYEYPPQLWKGVPVSDSTDSVTVHVSTTGSSSAERLLDRVTLRDTVDVGTRVGLPALRPARPHPPIFLLSIDTLPYSAREFVQPIVDALGPDTAVPTEPRTQAHWTPPSHASMFTGAHPGDHGYVGFGDTAGAERPINRAYTTIPELLTDTGYKCSGLVSHTRILPEFGFGRGCHRYRADSMGFRDWVTRNHDARESLSQVIEWIDADLRVRDHSLFYFVHLFDPHFPYLPPLTRIEDDDLDLSRPSLYREQFVTAREGTGGYLRMYDGNPDVDPALSAQMERYHAASIEYTAEQVARFVEYLRSVDLFDDALIIVTGDHGEEFGERGFFTHNSLYDRIIRPFVAIKPPASAAWSVPDAVDTIDFLPTIAHEVGVDVPDHCAGEPLQTKVDDPDPRITERITSELYNVAVEIAGIKGIFTYDCPSPDRPSAAVVDAGPILTEFYDLHDVRAGEYAERDEPSNASRFERIAEDFATSGADTDVDSSAMRPSVETERRLQDLGYM